MIESPASRTVSSFRALARPGPISAARSAALASGDRSRALPSGSFTWAFQARASIVALTMSPDEQRTALVLKDGTVELREVGSDEIAAAATLQVLQGCSGVDLIMRSLT